MSLPLICNICKKETEISFNFEISELSRINNAFFCKKCISKSFKNLVTKYNINKDNYLTKREFLNEELWGGLAFATIMCLFISTIILIQLVPSIFESSPSFFGLLFASFIIIPSGLIFFFSLKSLIKIIYRSINIKGEYTKYFKQHKVSQERQMEYKLLKEIRISLIDSQVSDVKEIKSAIKFLRWTNESDGYLIVYGIILQLENKFNEAIDVFKKVKYGDDRNVAFRLIADTYFQNKQYKNALSYYNKYQPILDSDRLRVESTISLCNTLIRVQKS